MRAILAVAVLIAGCASGPIVIDEIKSTEARLSMGDGINVSIPKADWRRVDKYVRAFGNTDKHGVETGGIWRMAFHGGASSPQLTIKSATLRESLAAGGFTMRYTYTAECELAYLGRAYQFEATGTRAAAMLTASAMRQAVELGVLDAARKTKAIIIGKSP